MSFHQRLYASLDVDLCRVRLHEPLSIIMQNPLLYVRDLVPKPCFEALAKLDKVSPEVVLGFVGRKYRGDSPSVTRRTFGI